MKKCKKCMWNLMCTKKIRFFCREHIQATSKYNNGLEKLNLNRE